MSWQFDSADALRAWGEWLGQRISGGGLICLSGDLGAGKTTLAGGILAGYGHVGRCKSPTYTIVEPYETPRGPVYHFDLYRLSGPQDLDSIGFYDYFSHQSLSVLEWPERAGDALPDPDLYLSLDILPDGRRLLCLQMSECGRKWLLDE